MLVLLVLLCCLFLPTFGIVGTGSDVTETLINEWLYDYLLEKPDFMITFDDPGANDDPIQELQSGAVDFIVAEAAEQIPNTVVIPIVSQALVFQINIPELDPDDDILILSREIIADIYCNQVNNWRDQAILELNPLLLDKLPNATIQVVIDSDETDEINRSSSLFVKWSETFNQTVGRISSFPTALTNLSNWWLKDDIPSTFSTLLYIPYSIGLLDNGWTSSVGAAYVHIVNLAGDVTGADSQDVMAGAQDRNTTGWVGDSPQPNAYPLIEIFFWILPLEVKGRQTNCSAYREFIKYIRYALTNPLANNQIVEQGYGPLHPVLVAESLARLNSITCNGAAVAALLDTRVTDRAFYVSCALAAIVLVFVLVLSACHTYFFRRNRIHLAYSLALVLGSSLVLTAPLFWFTKPENSSICLSRAWLTSLGAVILLASMFSRTWQLHELYSLDKNNKIRDLRQQAAGSKALVKLVCALLIFVVVDIVILTAWTISDPYQAQFVVTNNLDLIGSWQCVSQRLSAWISLQIVLLSGMIIFGIVVIYQTWTFSKTNVVNETRWVLIALYNIILMVCALLPTIGLSNLDDATLSIVMGVAIDFSALGVIFAVLLPRVVKTLLYGSSRSNGSNKEAFSQSSPKGDKRTETSELMSLKHEGTDKVCPPSPHALEESTNGAPESSSPPVTQSPSVESRIYYMETSQAGGKSLIDAPPDPSLPNSSSVDLPNPNSLQPIEEQQPAVRVSLRQSAGNPIFNPFK